MSRFVSVAKRILVISILAMSMSFVSSGIAAAETRAEETARISTKCNDRFLTFPAWYRGIQKDDCSLKSPSEVPGASENKLRNYIMRIALNIVEIMLQAVAYVSVGFIMYGGFKYLTSPSDSNKIAGGRKTIQNALVGLVISLLSIVIVNVVVSGIN